MASIKKNREDIIEKMKFVGTYNDSFEHTINVLAKVLHDYDDAIKLFNKANGNIVMKHTNKNGSTNIVKNPLYQAIEKLRDDVVSYSRELGLTPAGLKKINQDGANVNKKSNLLRVLDELK
jgi:phage terminase small subunit